MNLRLMDYSRRANTLVYYINFGDLSLRYLTVNELGMVSDVSRIGLSVDKL